MRRSLSANVQKVEGLLSPLGKQTVKRYLYEFLYLQLMHRAYLRLL